MQAPGERGFQVSMPKLEISCLLAGNQNQSTGNPEKYCLTTHYYSIGDISSVDRKSIAIFPNTKLGSIA